MSRALALVLGALVLGVGGAAAQAMAPRRGVSLQPAGRVDVLASRITAVQAGAELSVPAGRNLRIALVGAAGGSWADGASGLSARTEVVGRFLLDPDFSMRWTPYAAGGVGARYDRIADWSGVLVIAVGLEGPDWNGVVPFIEAGYGGGGRVGVGLRRTRAGGR